MNRLRKKSDAKKTQYPVLAPLQTSVSPPPSPNQIPQILPELPSEDDFRTSLILPDLTRRFSLLRNSSGEPLPVDLLRSRLAEQRARGVENQISEEEEDMILESLGLRTRYAAPADKSESIRSSSSRSTKRYSNNLFGSGRLRDYSYVRSTTSPSKHASSRIASGAPSEASSNELRPITPEMRSTPPIAPAPHTEDGPTEYRLSKSFGPNAFKRASLALEEAIRELEEDAEDEILMPRSTPITRASVEPRTTDNLNPDVFESGMAISSDHQVRTEPEEKRMSPLPSHILPGYIPGMPRPMTPREDMDNDILRSHSITPRAANGSGVFSPPKSMTPPPPSSTSDHSRQLSLSRPMSPPFLQRSIDPAQRGERGTEVTDFDSSPVPGRRRPASPLSGPSYQPFTAAAVSTSRPSTPSNVTWTFPATQSPPQKSTFKHDRNGSWFSDAEGSTDPHGGYTAHGHSKSTSRSLRSPALPDSPILERSSPSTAFFSASYSGGSYDNRPPSTISGIDLNSPTVRSPTPTQSPGRSPISPTFSAMDTSPRQVSKRSSKQNSNGLSSIPFSLSPYSPVLFSPIANSSRSSLESRGSSYHSWEDDNKFLFVDAEPQQLPWHDLAFSSQSGSITPGGSPDTEWDPEDVIGSYAGLHKSDFSAIQDKLVSAVAFKNSAVLEPRERVPSLRRRRPSTSQSNYSLNHRIVTPPPQQTPPSETTGGLNVDQISKASALLNSVLDSINRDASLPPINTTEVPASSQDISPSTRRNRDLAQVLFGENTPVETDASRPLSPHDDIPLSLHDNISHSDSIPKQTESISNSPSLPSFNIQPLNIAGLPSPSPSSFYNPLRSPSTPHIPQTLEEQADLAREVQRKADAAMLALRKRPSNSNLSKEGLVSTPSIRKKISPHQISTPTLVSASTSVDTIPLRTPLSTTSSSGPPSKIGSRFRKLRGTLRKGNLPIEEIKITPYPVDIQPNTTSSSQPNTTSSQTQFAVYDPVKLHPVDAVSASELGRFRVPVVPVPSPPASAGPGLKGFMARFRGKGRTADSVDYKSQQLRALPYQMSPAQVPSPVFPGSPLNEEAKSPTAINSQFTYASHSSPSMPQATHLSPNNSDQPADMNPQESLALKQLFNAANDLGLDRGQLSELLVRSGSISTKSTMLNRNNSTATKSRQENRDERQFRSPTPQGDWSTFEDPTRKTSVSRKSSMKQNDNVGASASPSVGTRRPRQRGQDDTNTIVRRTIIYPEDRAISVADLNGLARKGSRRRRASAISAVSSNRSVYERAPTPPPPRSPTARRFSTDESPPVPQLPPSWNKGIGVSPVGGHSNNTYDGYDDGYLGEKGSQSAPPEAGSSSEPGPALEVIELANGETIWSIVNGLRDDDADSEYAGRSSFQSDYDDEGLQVYVRDHTRQGSKGSNSSFLSRKKLLPAQGKNRPETKVFYTSSAQIGRLIENLSQGMDAGTFNFSQGHPEYSTSATSSMTGQTASDFLTVEERLEHMLGAMKTA